MPVETGLCGPVEVVGARLPLLLRQPARLLRRQVPPAGELGSLELYYWAFSTERNQILTFRWG